MDLFSLPPPFGCRQVFTQPATDGYPPLHCPTQLVQSLLAFQLSPSQLAQSPPASLRHSTSNIRPFFLIGFQWALALHSTAPAFLQPKSFRDIWALSDSLSTHVALSF